jgi:hypothetical protein
MGFYRVLTGAVVAALAACLAGHAMAQATQVIPPELAATVRDWGLCRGRVAAEHFKGQDDPEAVASETMSRCEPDQDKVQAAAAKAYGPEAAAALTARLAATARAQTVDLVIQTRAGAPASDPGVAYGECLGAQARVNALGGADADAVVDKVFAACRNEEQRVRAKLESQAGHDQAEALFSQIRGIFSDQIRKTIAQAREAR